MDLYYSWRRDEMCSRSYRIMTFLDRYIYYQHVSKLFIVIDNCCYMFRPQLSAII